MGCSLTLNPFFFAHVRATTCFSAVEDTVHAQFKFYCLGQPVVECNCSWQNAGSSDLSQICSDQSFVFLQFLEVQIQLHSV